MNDVVLQLKVHEATKLQSIFLTLGEALVLITVVISDTLLNVCRQRGMY